MTDELTPSGESGTPPNSDASTLRHDLKHCLHAIGMGIHVLKIAGEDETRRESTLDWMGKEHKRLEGLVKEAINRIEGPADSGTR